MVCPVFFRGHQRPLHGSAMHHHGKFVLNPPHQFRRSDQRFLWSEFVLQMKRFPSSPCVLLWGREVGKQAPPQTFAGKVAPSLVKSRAREAELAATALMGKFSPTRRSISYLTWVRSWGSKNLSSRNKRSRMAPARALNVPLWRSAWTLTAGLGLDRRVFICNYKYAHM